MQRVTYAEFTGFEEVSGSISLPRESDRIWRGSYKGKDWRYLVSLCAMCLSCCMPVGDHVVACRSLAVNPTAIFKALLPSDQQLQSVCNIVEHICTSQGDGAWEPKERTSKKPTKASSNPKTSSRPTSSNAHAQQSSDAPSSAEDARAVNDPDPNEREVRISDALLVQITAHDPAEELRIAQFPEVSGEALVFS